MNNTAVSMDATIEDEVSVELTNLAVNAGLGLANAAVLGLVLTAFVLMGRTSRVPYAARLLSRTLLALYAAMMVTCATRRFVMSRGGNVQLAVATACTRHLTGVTIVVISVERYLCVCRPMLYGRYGLRRRLKVGIVISLSSVTAAYYVMRFGVCSLMHDVTEVLTSAWVCKRQMAPFYLLSYGIPTVTCIACYVQIFRVIQSIRKRQRLLLQDLRFVDSFRGYKATVFVFINLVVFLVRIVSNAFLAYYTDVLTIADNRMYADLQWLVFCLCHCLIYSFWFKECRLELLKLMSCCSETIRMKAEKMRLEVYDVTVSTSKSTSSQLANGSSVSQIHVGH